MGFTVAIIGRPNVGKSTLFNRLVGRRSAIVDDAPGVTRDRRIGDARLGPLAFTVVDTAGLEEAFDDSLEARMRRQTERALEEADLGLFLIDARAGITPMDEHFAAWLRKAKTPVLVVANKCEGRMAEAGRAEAYGLGLGEPIAVSAAHGEGLVELLEAMVPYAEGKTATAWDGAGDGEPGDLDRAEFAEPDHIPTEEEEGEGTDLEPERDARPIQLAIVGRPNVGKSTLVNALIGEERMLTGPEPGVTRDAITVDWAWKGRHIRLVDTAGLRRRARVTDRVERLSVAETFEAIRLANVVVLVLDASAILDKQDLTIARHTIDEGRALVIAVNKWDAVENKAEALRRLSDRLQTSLAQVRGIHTVTISALKGRRLDELMDAVTTVYATWNRRLKTGRLNRWLAAMLEAHPPPLVSGRRMKIRYMTQVKARPPTFVLWVNRADEWPESYIRYLTNGLRDSFDLAGVPIRILMRQSKNPFAD